MLKVSKMNEILNYGKRTKESYSYTVTAVRGSHNDKARHFWKLYDAGEGIAATIPMIDFTFS